MVLLFMCTIWVRVFRLSAAGHGCDILLYTTVYWFTHVVRLYLIHIHRFSKRGESTKLMTIAHFHSVLRLECVIGPSFGLYNEKRYRVDKSLYQAVSLWLWFFSETNFSGFLFLYLVSFRSGVGTFVVYLSHNKLSVHTKVNELNKNEFVIPPTLCYRSGNVLRALKTITVASTNYHLPSFNS